MAVQNPLLCEEDGPVYQLRRWYEQFYTDVADVKPEMTDRVEFEVDTTRANESWHAEVAENLKKLAEAEAGRYTRARLVEMQCLDCLATVRVKKNSEHHTLIQWSAEAIQACPELCRRTSSNRRDGLRGCPRLAARGSRLASTPRRGREKSRSAPKTDTDRGEVVDIESFVLDVVDVVEETADAKSISFAVPDGAAEKFAYKPGQFLTVAVPSDQTGIAARCYSLSSSPHDGGPLTVTVKRTADGYASNWICDRLEVGDTLRVLPPSGIFTPASLDRDLLLFGGGSGITPIMAITRTTLAQGTGNVVLFYANRDEKSVIFADELTRLAAEHPDRLQVIHWLESVQGIPTAEQMKAFASLHLGHDAFVCGPAPFMKMVTGVLKELDFPRDRRHQEKFVSLGGNPFGDVAERQESDQEIALAEADDDGAAADVFADAPAGPVKVEVELDGEEFTFDDWDPRSRLLDFLESKGVKAPYSCREGECSACAIRLLEGEVKMLHNDVLDEEDLADGIRLGCQSVPMTDTVKVTYS